MVYERKPAPGSMGDDGNGDKPLTNQNKSMEGRPGQTHGADGIEGQRGRDWTNPENGAANPPHPGDAANERPAPGLAGYGDEGQGYTGHPIDQGYTEEHRPDAAADDPGTTRAGTIDDGRGSTRPGSDRL